MYHIWGSERSTTPQQHTDILIFFWMTLGFWACCEGTMTQWCFRSGGSPRKISLETVARWSQYRGAQPHSLSLIFLFLLFSPLASLLSFSFWFLFPGDESQGCAHEASPRLRAGSQHPHLPGATLVGNMLGPLSRSAREMSELFLCASYRFHQSKASGQDMVTMKEGATKHVLAVVFTWGRSCCDPEELTV